MTPEVDGRIRQFKRIVISFADFKYAFDISSYILEQNLHDDFENNKLLLSALDCSMIVSYCRPFSGNDSSNELKVPDLAGKALRVFNGDELIVHKLVMNYRNKLLAHSDSEAIDLKFIRNEIGGKVMLQPVRNWSMAPLNERTLILFNSASEKLLSHVATQRLLLEPEIEPLLGENDLCDEVETEEYGIGTA